MKVIYLSLIAASMMVCPKSFAVEVLNSYTNPSSASIPDAGAGTTSGGNSMAIVNTLATSTSTATTSSILGEINKVATPLENSGSNWGFVDSIAAGASTAASQGLAVPTNSVHLVQCEDKETMRARFGNDVAAYEKFLEAYGCNSSGAVSPVGNRMASTPAPTNNAATGSTTTSTSVSLDFGSGGRNPASNGQTIIIGDGEGH